MEEGGFDVFDSRARCNTTNTTNGDHLLLITKRSRCLSRILSGNAIKFVIVVTFWIFFGFSYRCLVWFQSEFTVQKLQVTSSLHIQLRFCLIFQIIVFLAFYYYLQRQSGTHQNCIRNIYHRKSKAPWFPKTLSARAYQAPQYLNPPCCITWKSGRYIHEASSK